MSDPRRFGLDPDTLAFDAASGLLPAIVQAPDGRVLMLGWMSREAVARTLETGRVTFFSRSRSRLWEKGETSGHWLEVESLATDCDRDALLVSARPHGPTCHTGRRSCFDADFETQIETQIEAESRTRVEAEIAASPDPPGALGSALDRLYSRVARRAVEGCEGSYTAALLDAGTARIAQKLGEEGVETAIAAVQGEGRLVEESVDLLYHLLVLWRSRGVLASDVAAEITRREDES